MPPARKKVVERESSVESKSPGPDELEESSNEDAPSPSKTKARARAKRAPKAKQASKNTETSTGKASAAKGKGKKVPVEPEVTVEWDTALRCQLVAAIVASTLYKSVLYPGPGANQSTARGGGTPKTDIHWSIAKEVLGPIDKYKKHIDGITTATKDSARRSKWGNKVKATLNVMQGMVVKFDKGLEHMTGSGVTEEERADGMENKQAAFSEKNPWYEDLKGLIAERPNLKPHGIGNSQAGFNTSIFAPGAPEDNGAPDDSEEPGSGAWPNGGVDPLDDDDATEPRPGARRAGSVEMAVDREEDVEAPAQPPVRTKRRRSPSLTSSDPEDISAPSRPSPKVKKGKETSARPSTSTPAKKDDKQQQKKKTKTSASSDRLNGAVAEENATQRELIKARRANTDAQTEISKAKILADTRLKERKLELKAQRLLQRDRFAHERQLAQAQASGYGRFQAPPYGPGSRAPSPPYAHPNQYGRGTQPAPYARSSYGPGSQTNDRRWDTYDGGAMDVDIDGQPFSRPSDSAADVGQHDYVRRSHEATLPNTPAHSRRMPMRQAAPEHDMVNMRQHEGHARGSYSNVGIHHASMSNGHHIGSASRPLSKGRGTAPGSPAFGSADEFPEFLIGGLSMGGHDMESYPSAGSSTARSSVGQVQRSASGSSSGSSSVMIMPPSTETNMSWSALLR